MEFDAPAILAVLDRCCDSFTFPMLDNGYVYLAATRLSLFRSVTDWAIVIEVFGFSPRSGLPDNHIHTFASNLHHRDSPKQYESREAYDNYIANNPHNDSRFIFPLSEGPWLDEMNGELVAVDAKEIAVRGDRFVLPSLDEYRNHGIDLEQPPRVQVFELCRFLADILRANLLAIDQERRISVLADMKQILQLEEWHHPNVVENDRPSNSETFQQLAQVLVSGDAKLYRPSKQPNTHWRNWPDGGTL